MIADGKLTVLHRELMNLSSRVDAMDRAVKRRMYLDIIKADYPDIYNGLIGAPGNYVRIRDDLHFKRNSKHNRIYVSRVTLMGATPTGSGIKIDGMADDGNYSIYIPQIMFKSTIVKKSKCKPETLERMRSQFPPVEEFSYIEF